MTEAVFVLHAYQPPYPIQIPEVIERIIENTYLPFAKLANKLEGATAVLNINGCLTEMLQESSPEVVELLRQAIQKGTLELVDSGFYHPIFPMISDDRKEFVAHINKNRQINTKAFDLPNRPIGFWPPELALSTKTAQWLAGLGYQAIVAPYNILRTMKPGWLPAIQASSSDRLALLLRRDKRISNCIGFRKYDSVGRAANDICQTGHQFNIPIVIAMDLETFGEHHSGYMDFLLQLLNRKDIRWMGIKDVVEADHNLEIQDSILSSSWSTEDSDRDNGIPFPLWDHPQNPIHHIQHAHMGLLRACVKLHGDISTLNLEQTTEYLASQHSCQFWWAHGCGHMWCPSMIIKGMELQITALDHISQDLDEAVRVPLKQQSEAIKRRLDESLRTR
jgi:alpha-amylase/alpha-mannosidase (GH57 family)